VVKEQQRAPRAPMPMWVWYCLAVVLVANFGLALGGFLWTSHAIQVEHRAQCRVYTPVDAAYRKVPPTTPAGRAFAAVIHGVVTDLGCEESQ
jgi:hypothetical protein